MMTDPNYLRFADFGNFWGIVMLVKHIHIFGMIAMGSWFNAILRVDPMMSSNTGMAGYFPFPLVCQRDGGFWRRWNRTWFYKKMKGHAPERQLPNATSEDFQRYARNESRKTWELHQADLIRELYVRTNQQTAVLEYASTDDAQNIFATLPYAREGFYTFDLIPLKAYSGFGCLFNDDEVSREGYD